MIAPPDRMVDLVSERFDLAVRITARLADAALVQRRLCPIRFVVCAAPSYLETHGVPRAVGDLAQHNCLNPSGPPWRGILSRGRLSPGRSGRIHGDLNLDNADALYRVALLGHGIVCLPTFIAGEDLREGRLVRILPHQLALGVSRRDGVSQHLATTSSKRTRGIYFPYTIRWSWGVSSCGGSARSKPPVANHARVLAAARRISVSEEEKS